MSKARSAGVSVPNIRFVGDFQIRMDYIDGEKVKNVLNTVKSDKRCRICEGIGAIAAKLHEANIIHGDLTTSNIIIRNNDLYLIDFGLGKVSHKTEDKAVDMFLLYEALKSTHFRVLDECWRNILKIYVQEYSEAKAVIERMEVIKRRRRYK
jgi:Kae1-associated kinase Bud32